MNVRRIQFRCIRFLAVLLTLWVPGFDSLAQENKEQDQHAHQIVYERANALHKLLQFDSAIHYYTQYYEWARAGNHAATANEARKRILECESGKKLLSAPRNFLLTNLGPDVNSKYEDYAPVLSEDESVLVFTSRRPDGNLNQGLAADGRFYEDIFESRRENGEWMQVRNLGPPVNTPFHDSNLALSADGKQLFIYSDRNEGDILVSRCQNNQWTKPTPLPWPINTAHHESSISADGKRFFVASERPGGLGGSDIWIVEKNAAGQWKASNPGPAINTIWDEDGPFMDYDLKTLYFSSNGHNAMGGFDIFRSRWNVDHWDDAENLGYPINTPGNDSYFVSAKDGKRAYYSSVREGGMGEEDLYMITLPKELERNDETDSLAAIKPGPRSILPMVIYFDFRSAALSPQAAGQLRSFIEQVRDDNAMIQIEGHADSIGKEAFNDDLSLARASAVYSFLKTNGIGSQRMKIKGWGTRKPAASNEREIDGRALNRRVELRVIDN